MSGRHCINQSLRPRRPLQPSQGVMHGGAGDEAAVGAVPSSWLRTMLPPVVHSGSPSLVPPQHYAASSEMLMVPDGDAGRFAPLAGGRGAQGGSNTGYAEQAAPPAASVSWMPRLVTTSGKGDGGLGGGMIPVPVPILESLLGGSLNISSLPPHLASTAIYSPLRRAAGAGFNAGSTGAVPLGLSPDGGVTTMPAKYFCGVCGVATTSETNLRDHEKVPVAARCPAHVPVSRLGLQAMVAKTGALAVFTGCDTPPRQHGGDHCMCRAYRVEHRMPTLFCLVRVGSISGVRSVQRTLRLMRPCAPRTTHRSQPTLRPRHGRLRRAHVRQPPPPPTPGPALAVRTLHSRVASADGSHATNECCIGTHCDSMSLRQVRRPCSDGKWRATSSGALWSCG